MKSNKYNKSLITAVRRRGGLVPSWVVFATIIIATFSLCAVIMRRTYISWSEASAQHQKLDIDIESLRKTNLELEHEVDRLRSDPRAIESAARTRLNMVMPNEVIVPTDDPPVTDEQSVYAESQTSGSSTINNRLPSYLLLALYCGTAVIAGFIVIKSLIALLQYIARRGESLPSNLPLLPSSHGGKNKWALNTLSRLALLLICGLVLAGSFTYSAGQYSAAMSLRDKSEDLGRERGLLLDQQRRSLLEREQLVSPSRLEAAASELGMVPVRPGMIRYMKPSGSVAVKKPLESISVKTPTESVSHNNIDMIPPQTLKIILIILALLGGTLAVVFSLPNLSELLIRVRPQQIRVESAPGSNYLSLVDFFCSPKAVEEIFKPIIADWRIEYFEALKQRRTWKARWISIRYHYRLIQTVGLSKVFSLIKIFKSASK